MYAYSYWKNYNLLMLNYGGILLVNRELILTILFWFIVGFLVEQGVSGLIELIRFWLK